MQSTAYGEAIHAMRASCCRISTEPGSNCSRLKRGSGTGRIRIGAVISAIPFLLARAMAAQAAEPGRPVRLHRRRHQRCSRSSACEGRSRAFCWRARWCSQTVEFNYEN